MLVSRGPWAPQQRPELLGIATRKFSQSTTFLEKVTAEHPDLTDYRVLAVRKELDLETFNSADPFFDSFRRDYVGFDRWFNQQGRRAGLRLQDRNLVTWWRSFI